MVRQFSDCSNENYVNVIAGDVIRICALNENNEV